MCGIPANAGFDLEQQDQMAMFINYMALCVYGVQSIDNKNLNHSVLHSLQIKKSNADYSLDYHAIFH